jgi:hypothetical protein
LGQQAKAVAAAQPGAEKISRSVVVQQLNFDLEFGESEQRGYSTLTPL